MEGGERREGTDRAVEPRPGMARSCGLISHGPQPVRVSGGLAVFTTELVYTTCRVNQSLLAGIERMAGGANFDVEITTDG